MDNGDYSKFESNIRDISNALQFLENYLRTLEIGEDKITKFSNMRKIMRRTWGAMVFESQFTMEEKEELYGLLNAVSMEETSNVPLPEDRYCYLLDTPFDLRFNNIKKEIQKIRNNRFRAFALQQLHQMIVSRRGELHQNLAYNANPGLLDVF